MEREKQIELERDLIEIFNEEYEKRHLITPANTAKKLTEKGYRKERQGEWISVEDRLPDKRDLYLCYCEYYLFEKHNVYEICQYFPTIRDWMSQGSHHVGFRVLAWMPLPEPPKMKGAE